MERGKKTNRLDGCSAALNSLWREEMNRREKERKRKRREWLGGGGDEREIKEGGRSRGRDGHTKAPGEHRDEQLRSRP